MRLMLCLLLMLPLAVEASSTLRCASRVVIAGDWDFTLGERCGEPFHVDHWSELHSVRTGVDTAVSRLVRFEDWYFDFGPDRLLVRARLRDGQVQRFDVLGRRGRHSPLADCGAGTPLHGLSSGELVSLCGAPAQRQSLDEALLYGVSPAETVLPLRRERWVYRGSSGSGGIVVWLDAGQVTRVDPLRR